MVFRRTLLVMMAFCLLLFPKNGLTQQKVVAAEVLHTGIDSLGKKLAGLVRERIKRSGGLRLANDNETRMRIYLVSVDIFEDIPGKATAFGWTATMKDTTGPEIYLNSGEGTSVNIPVNRLADKLVAIFDKEANYLRMNLFK
jgi:hypothetical protein